MLISDILRHKTAGTAVVTISPSATVSELLGLLAEHRIGALVVVDHDAVVGIVSERDIVRRLHSGGAEVLQATVADLMVSPVISCGPDDPVDSVATTMTERRFRHMPVLDGAALVGIVSIGDVVVSRMHALEQDRHHLEQYITG